MEGCKNEMQKEDGMKDFWQATGPLSECTKWSHDPSQVAERSASPKPQQSLVQCFICTLMTM